MSGWWLVAFGLYGFALWQTRRAYRPVVEPRSHVDPPRPAPTFYDWQREVEG